MSITQDGLDAIERCVEQTYAGASDYNLARAALAAIRAQCPGGSTIRVRAAVAVWPDGAWCVSGWPEATDEDAEESVVCDSGGTPAVHFITADVPLPVAREIVATVETEQ